MTLFSLFSIVAVSCSVTCDGCYRKQLDVTDARPSKCVSEALTLWRPALGKTVLVEHLEPCATWSRLEAGESNPSIGSKFSVDSLMFRWVYCKTALQFCHGLKSWNHMKSIEMWWIRWDFSYDVPPQSDSNPRRRAGDIAGEAWECEAQTWNHHFGGWCDAAKLGVSTPVEAFMAPGLSIRALAGPEPITSIEASFKVSNNQSLWVCLILCSSSQPPWKWSIQVFLHMQCLPSMYIIWGCLRNGARACIARHGQRASCTISHVPYKFPSFSDLSQIWKAKCWQVDLTFGMESTLTTACCARFTPSSLKVH